MVVKKIVLNNFRVYYGVNALNLSVDLHKNVSVISGNNGYGKTSLLTSMVWCLYGKLMAEVDDRYRREISESGGYKKYCEKLMNWRAAGESLKLVEELKDKRSKVNAIDQRKVDKEIQQLQSFSVSVYFSKLYIPSLQCEELVVQRTYNSQTHHEETEILIDGRANELTRGIGENIFINDFILPKEIAKFFFFDAEKIVSLAEIRSADERKELSYAYSEVLGIKKYVDLKENLENLQFRIRNKSSRAEDRKKADKLKISLDQQLKMIELSNFSITEKREELVIKKAAADKLQEQLIREGTSLSLDELKEFKNLRDSLAEDNRRFKNNLDHMMEFIPFLIAGSKLKTVKEQMEKEHNWQQMKVSGKLLKMKSRSIAQDLKKHKKELRLNKQQEKKLTEIINSKLSDAAEIDFDELLNFTDDQYKQFNSIYVNLSGSFSKSFRDLLSDMRKNQSSYSSINRKLTDAESKEKDPVIKRVRDNKMKMDESINRLEEEVIQEEAQKLQIQHEYNNTQKLYKELNKNIRIEEVDKMKDDQAYRLIKELSDFIQKLKIKKKKSLETNIKIELNRLMHKSAFIHKVNVIVEGDMIDVELFNKRNQLINKESLSKGEQQLYATALLRALIEESNIQFPVFIDSPLQKFDKEHSKNIITEFYPRLSSQVILFPLIEKELTEEEYGWLRPFVGVTYAIEHEQDSGSIFVPLKTESLFKDVNKYHSHA